MVGYTDLTYADLQKACKQRGLPARGCVYCFLSLAFSFLRRPCSLASPLAHRKKNDMIAALETEDGKGGKKGGRKVSTETKTGGWEGSMRAPLFMCKKGPPAPARARPRAHTHRGLWSFTDPTPGMRGGCHTPHPDTGSPPFFFQSSLQQSAAADPAPAARSLLHSASKVPLPGEAAAGVRSRRGTAATAAPATPAARPARGGRAASRAAAARPAQRGRAAALAGLVPVAAALLLAAAALGGAVKYTVVGGRAAEAGAAAVAPALAAVSGGVAAAAAAAGRAAAPALSAAAPLARAASLAAGSVRAAGFTASTTVRRQASAAWGGAGGDGAGGGGGVGAALAAALATLRARVGARLPSPFPPPAAPPPVPCGRALAPELVPMIAAAGPAWAGARAALAEALASHGRPVLPGDQPKASAVLLAGWDRVALGAAALAVSEAAPGAGPCAGCVLAVQPEDVADSAALQAAVTPFLARCPGGVVALPRAHELPPAALPALLALLGERGAFEDGGVPVPATGALVVLTAAAPPALQGSTDEAALASAAKAALGDALAGDAPGADARSAALRRRIDLVVPLRE